MCPTKKLGYPEAYTHLAVFCRNAPATQVDGLWKLLASEFLVRLESTEAAVWLSTSGLGVSWLHFRLDNSPKYYQYSPYKAFDKQRKLKVTSKRNHFDVKSLNQQNKKRKETEHHGMRPAIHNLEPQAAFEATSWTRFCVEGFSSLLCDRQSLCSRAGSFRNTASDGVVTFESVPVNRGDVRNCCRARRFRAVANGKTMSAIEFFSLLAKDSPRAQATQAAITKTIQVR